MTIDWEPSDDGLRHGTVWLPGPLGGSFGFAVYHDPDKGGFHLGNTVEFRAEAPGQPVSRQILEAVFAQFPLARMPRGDR